MSERKGLDSMLCPTSSLVLLAAILVAPIETSVKAVSPRPDCPVRNFALPPGQPTARINSAMATHAALEVDAIPSEIEELDRVDALDESRISFLIPWSFYKIPDRQLLALPSILSHYPLRC